MGKLRRSILSGAVAMVVVASALEWRGYVTADPVLGSSELALVPSMVLADAPAKALVTISTGTYGAGGFGGWSSGATVQVLDEDGRALRSVQIGERPSQALIDPTSGHLFVVTATAPGSTGGGFFASGAYLSEIDPASGMVLRTSAIAQPPPYGSGGFGGGGGGGRGFRGGIPGPPSPWQVAYSYAMPPMRGGGAMGLDAARRHLFVGGSGPGADGQANVAVVDADTGSILRTIPLQAPLTAVAVDPALARVLVADRSGTVTLLDARSLAPVGRLAAGVASQIAVDSRRGRAFMLATATSVMTTIDTRRAVVLGVARVAPGATGIQVDEGTGHVFVESTGVATSGFGVLRGGGPRTGPGPGTVTMLDAAGGKLLRTIRVGTLPFGAALDGQHHQLFVGSFEVDATGAGSVEVLDTASGAHVGTIAVPAGPFGLAMDTVRGHVVVAGLGDESRLHGAWPSTVEQAAQLMGHAATTPTPSGPPGAVTILKAAH